MLAGAAVGACAVMLVATFATGHLAMWALISVGLFHAIMFPTIFTLGIRGLGPLTEEGAGLLIMAIAGGALVVVQGWAADRFGLQPSFLITAACELYVLFYALWGCRPGPRATGLIGAGRPWLRGSGSSPARAATGSGRARSGCRSGGVCSGSTSTRRP